VDRLINALALLEDPETGRPEVGIHEKGLSALESLLFAKYQMFRNVYWHHAVRAATALYKRMVEEALAVGIVGYADLVGETDEGFLGKLETRARGREESEARRVVEEWLPALRYRRLPKRVLELPGEAVRDSEMGRWYYRRPDLRRAVEAHLAVELDLPPGSVFLDYPEKPRMMGLDLLLLQRDGRIRRLPESGHAGLIDLPRIADQLYHSARVFRVFSTERRRLDAPVIEELMRMSEGELERDLLEAHAEDRR
jgi:uncharacterized protein